MPRNRLVKFEEQQIAQTGCLNIETITDQPT
jgi:hypothetical protein